MAIEDAVFLRSVFGEGKGGDWMGSFVDVFLESHENGLVSFLVGAAGIGSGCEIGGGGALGGAAQGTEGKTPDRP